MNNLTRLLFIGTLALCTFKCHAQNNIFIQMEPKDFAIWAFQKHNEICRVIYENLKSGKLASYNAKNTKETTADALSKIATAKVVVFVQTDKNDPAIGHDSAYMAEKSDNYYLFKNSGEYILMKPENLKTNLLKFKKAELLALFDMGQKEYFSSFTSNYTLCIDSIPAVSRRVFSDFNSKLFEFSQKPSVKLFINDSMKDAWTVEEKTNLSKDEYTAFLATDPDDPTIGYDTLILTDYDIRDTMKEQAIIFMVNLKDFKLDVNAVSSGMERKLMGVMPYIIPYGYLPYLENAPFTANEMHVLNSVLEIRMLDALNNQRNFKDSYYDFYGK